MYVDSANQTWMGASELASLPYSHSLEDKWNFDEENGRYKRTNLSRFMKGSFVNELNRDEGEISFRDAVERAIKGEKFIGIEVAVASNSHRVYGQIDELEITPDGIIVKEDKEKITVGALHQVRAYALALQEYVGSNVPIFCSLRDVKTNQVCLKERFTDSDKQAAIDAIEAGHSRLRRYLGQDS